MQGMAAGWQTTRRIIGCVGMDVGQGRRGRTPTEGCERGAVRSWASSEGHLTRVQGGKAAVGTRSAHKFEDSPQARRQTTEDSTGENQFEDSALMRAEIE